MLGNVVQVVKANPKAAVCVMKAHVSVRETVWRQKPQQLFIYLFRGELDITLK